MSSFSLAIGGSTPFLRSAAVAGLLGATMLGGAPGAARAEDAASGSLPQAAPAAERPLALGSAKAFAVLSKAGISTTGSTKIDGNIGVSPIASTAITGFGLKLAPSRRFSTSSLVTGRIYAANYRTPTPSGLTTAVHDMQVAYADAADRKNPTATELGHGNIGGRTIRPGLYKWSSGVIIPTNVTLLGDKDAVWVFQIAGTLNISAGKRVILSGGAVARNVFWQVAGKTTLQTTADFNGTVLDKTEIAIKTGAKLHGRALAQTAVTLEANSILTAAAVGTRAPDAVPAPAGSLCPVACAALSGTAD